MKFGDYLRHLRMERGWTQPEAAGRAGIEQSYLSKLETGKSVPSGEIYDRLVGVYNIDDEAMLAVLVPEELERLREIDSLRAAILSRSDRRRALPRRWLTVGIGLLALGGACVGLSLVDQGHDITTYTYMSDGVLADGQSLEDEPIVSEEQSRFIVQMRGPAFTEPSPQGTRLWRLVGSASQWQPSRFGWALVPGLAAILAGLGCFFLAWRWR